MKKIISLLMIAMMILSIIVFVPVSAQDNSSEAELEAVLLTGYKYYNTFHSVDGYHEAMSDRFDILIYPYLGNPIMTKQFTIKDSNGKTENVEYEYWYMFDKYDFKTFENVAEVRQYVGNCFAEGYIDDFLTFDTVIDAESGDTKKINLFEESADGKLIMCYKFGYDGLKYQYTDFQISEMNENSATATVTLGCVTRQMPYDLSTPFGFYFKDEPGWLPSVETVEFTKTADGWRISGGTMFAVMLGEREPSDVVPPNTGDETALLVALLALSGIAIAVVPKRKRRI